MPTSVVTSSRQPSDAVIAARLAAIEAKDYGPTKICFAIQNFRNGKWVTTNLYCIREFAEKKIATLGEGWRVHDVRREILD